MKYQNIREEELKNKVAQDYFWIYDCTKIIGNVDFCVCMHQSQKESSEQEFLLWAEAKKGSADIYKSIVQLILTIGKARTFDKFLPPAMLGAFDAEKIAFVPYNDIHEVFYINDFNWNVTPSNHNTKEFKLIYERVKTIIDSKALLFNFLNDDRELKKFIKKNFIVGKFGLTKTRIDKNNFMVIYNKWLQSVKPSIAVNWEVAKKGGIIDGDFYLADLISQENTTLKDKLFVLLKKDHYELDRKIDEAGMFSSKRSDFSDNQVAHTQFWNKYERPPKEEYWDYIVERRDLLVPQDVRERKGSFFTPQIWVELSQKYLSDVLGEDWQDEYYVWDCAAGTGNLLAGLTNKYNIWASTLDNQDVEVMHDRIKNGANLLDSHVFQFDFLNDDFSKLPKPLQDIINDPQKREKMIVYINPPYAEAAKYGDSKAGISSTKTYFEFKNIISFAVNELFSQFFARIYKEVPACKLAAFSKLKYITASNFEKFRNYFKAKNLKGFVCRASTFDNVRGNFPISFLIWDLGDKEQINEVTCDVIDNDGIIISKKSFISIKKGQVINDWLRNYYDKENVIGYLRFVGPDFQANSGVYITSEPKESDIKESRIQTITQNNLLEMTIYIAVRFCVEVTWLNDRDQFLYPNSDWINDSEFQNDCLAYTIFCGQNRITSAKTNHWIPFTEHEVNAREKFESNFMSRFIKGKISPEKKSIDIFSVLLEPKVHYESPLIFSATAQAVFDAGRELWRYYHAHPNCNVNASLYDIREHFQGRNAKGKMNNNSDDETYTKLIGSLRDCLKLLAKKIEQKVYEYGFLKD
jgi:predicted RNA methylase